jgi:ADP-heptose:LPS heptosyltransferase
MRLRIDLPIGDTLMVTPALRAFRRARPREPLIVFSASETCRALLRHNPHITEFVAVAPGDTPAVDHHLDAMRASLAGRAARKSLAWGFGRELGVEIDGLRYDYAVEPDERERATALLARYARPVILVGRQSVHCTSNDPSRGGVASKCLPNAYWTAAAGLVAEAGFIPLAVGSADEAGDPRYAEWPGEKLYGLPIRDVAALAAACRGVLTVNNGLRHLAAAAGGNLLCFAANARLWHVGCIPVRPGQVIAEHHKKLRRITQPYVLGRVASFLHRDGTAGGEWRAWRARRFGRHGAVANPPRPPL